MTLESVITLLAIGCNLLADQSLEAKQLLAFLRVVSQADMGKDLETPRDVGLAWLTCMDVENKHPDSELARTFKLLSEAWTATSSAPFAESCPFDETRVRAEKGEAAAQTALGGMYLSGKGVPRDYAEAAKWFRQAATQGDTTAQFNLGVMYEKGEGMPRDYAEAIKLFRQAAAQGDAAGLYGLGLAYVHGYGVPHDDAEAIKLFRQAVEQGHAGAQYSLGMMYGKGAGVPLDTVAAYMWISLAGAQGHDRARELLNKLEAILPTTQREQAQKLVQEWMAAHTY